MLDNHFQDMKTLLEDGGYVMLAIFILSVYLYTLAFRAFRLSSLAARPIKSVVEQQLSLNAIPNRTRFWQRIRICLEDKSANQTEKLHFLSVATKRIQRTITAQLSLLKLLAAASPLLGLLGTITGMVETFTALSSDKSGATARMVAEGISKALLTTNAGLMVAIPAAIFILLTKAKAKQAATVFTALQNEIRNQSKQAA